MKVIVRAATLAGFVLALALPAAATPPFSFDAAPGRLPKNVVPIDYTIAIVPNPSYKTLTGTEKITLNVRSATRTVQLNSLNETVSNARFDGAPVAKTLTENAKQLTTFTLARAASVGTHVLTFAYTAAIETAPQGLFAQPFAKPNHGGPGFMLSTQFEATDARRMFPCWDEPSFRSTFALSATVPAAWATTSNMPIASRVVRGSLATTTFKPTPKMPSYLLEFSGGDLGYITAQSGGTTFSVWAPKGEEQEGRVALANSQTILADYNDYFGVKFPLPKLDSIAVPGGFQGAMENWGAITYNDQTLLLNDSSTIGNRQTVFSIQAHEMAHQWNGDLVTMGWWDDLWLNESFASWMAAKETALRNPTWNWLENEDGTKEVAMAADARITSHPIETHITDELQASTSFDPEITYAKGQIFLQMLEAYMTPDTFRDGIRHYMQARKFSNATSGDLWKYLSAASGKDIAAVSAAWTEQAGFPLVTAVSTCAANGARTVTFTQKRFLLQGTDPKNQHWSIPLVIRSGTGDATQRMLFTKDGQSILAGTCDQPLSANAGDVGFYRVAYDSATAAVNAKAFGTLPNPDRIALLDDTWALVQNGGATLPSYLALAASMGNDLDARAWNQILGSLGEIARDERGTPGEAKFLAYARTIVKPVADQLGWDAKPGETPDIQQLRRTANFELGTWGDPSIVAEARKRFAAFVADRRTLVPDDQRTILSIAAINADQATFDQLHKIAQSAKNETELRRYYGALMNVKDPVLGAQAVKIAMSSEIPPQAAAVRLNLIIGLATYQPKLSWEAFKANEPALVAPLASFAPIALAEYVPAGYWDAAPLSEIEAYVKSKIPAEMAPNLARGMESGRFAAKLKEQLVPATDAYVAAQGSFTIAPAKTMPVSK